MWSKMRIVTKANLIDKEYIILGIYQSIKVIMSHCVLFEYRPMRFSNSIPD